MMIRTAEVVVWTPEFFVWTPESVVWTLESVVWTPEVVAAQGWYSDGFWKTAWAEAPQSGEGKYLLSGPWNPITVWLEIKTSVSSRA